MRDTSCLRLRLVVQRHALPEVRVVFVAQLQTDPTIANLLEQVNEILPLESNDWGLEDYAVELHDADGHAFDCLHFQQVSVVLKNDEEVFIRPLDTGDRRKRRLSGRDQISADGRHLIDGVAFGRPRLRIPRDRPPVDIPPLKRRRITYDEEEGEDQEPQLLLTEGGEENQRHRRGHFRARFEDTDGAGFEGDEERDDEFVDQDADEDNDADTDEDDRNFNMDDRSDSDMEDELRDLQADTEQALPDQRTRGSRVSNQAAQPSELDLLTLEKISALRAAFPTVPAGECERALRVHGGDLELGYYMLGIHHTPVMSAKNTIHAFQTAPPPRLEEVAAAEHAELEEPDDLGESEAESVASIIKHYDQHGFPGGSILDGTASAHMAEAMRKSGLPVKAPVHTKFDEEPNTRHNRSSSPVSSAPGSGSESESDSGPEIASSKPPKKLASSKLAKKKRSSKLGDSESESDRESNSEGDSGSDIGSHLSSSSGSDNELDPDDSDSDSDDIDHIGKSSDLVPGTDESSDERSLASSASSSGNDDSDGGSSAGSSDNDESGEESHVSSASSSDSDNSDAESSSDEESSDDSLGCASKSPVARKKKTAAPLTHLTASTEAAKLVPPGKGKTATQRRNARRRTALKALKAAVRGELLPAPAEPAGVLPQAGSTDISASIAAKKAALLQSLNLLGVPTQETRAEDGKAKGKQLITPEISMVGGLVPDSSTPSREPVTPSQQSSKLDVSAGRRIIFGALGLKNPKTKTDEEQLRSVLMDGIEPIPNYRLLDSVTGQDQHPQDEDPESWRDKINYRAVECCYEVELSEPPFPFVQRWDPQQQYFPKGNQRGGHSKRKQRSQEDYIDEESQFSVKRRKYGGGAAEYAADGYDEESYMDQYNGTGYEDTTLNYDDEPQETPKQREQTPIQEAEEDDLPILPADLTALPFFEISEARPGMVLTWKQWLLSKNTNWQPQVSDLTGIVVDALDDVTLGVRLAKRDQNLDRNEKVYDDDGNRVYDKFELPDLDSEGEEAEEQSEGYRTLHIADMIEPRIVQAAPQEDGIYQEEIEPPSDQLSVTLDREEAGEARVYPQEANIDTQPEHRGQSIASEASVHPVPVEDVSMSEDRRHEISLLMHDAGFRREIDPSVTKSPSLDLSSPSRQLEEMTYHAPIATSELSGAQSPARSVTASQSTSNNIDSQPILLEPFHGFSDATEPPEEGRIAYPKLELPPSDTGSIPSGRQVDPDYSIELGNDPLHGFDDDAGAVLDHDSDNDQDGSASVASIDSFPSLSELWPTASTNESKSRGNSAVPTMTLKTEAVPDLEYEEAMRRIDNADTSEDDNETQQQRLSNRAQQLVDKPIEKPTPRKSAQQKPAPKPFTASHIKTERPSPSPSAVGSRASQTRSTNSSQFLVPPGSQVVSLLSSSPEPELTENYAEDDIDETYQEESQMPLGPGWRKKSVSRSRREISMPASSALREMPKRFASTQPSRPGGESRGAAALESILKAKKKLADRY